MALGPYSWYEVTADFFRIKFLPNLMISTLIDENFVVTDDQATPTTLPFPFLSINPIVDYDSISRLLTLWWDDYPTEDGTYNLNISNLKNFLGEDVADFVLEFNWVVPGESATPDSDDALRPSHEPVEIADYSIKAPGWVNDDTVIDTGTSTGFEVLTVVPAEATSYYLSPDSDFGRIDVEFNKPVLMNFVSSEYFQVSKKLVKRGIASWTAVDAAIVTNGNSKTVSIYLPLIDSGLESATPLYSYNDVDEVTSPIYFEEQYKYRLVISAAVATFGDLTEPEIDYEDEDFLDGGSSGAGEEGTEFLDGGGS